MNKMSFKNKVNICSRTISTNTNHSLSSAITYESDKYNLNKNKKKKVSFKKHCVEIIDVDCWKKYNDDTAKDIYEKNSFDFDNRKNEEISCICNIF